MNENHESKGKIKINGYSNTKLHQKRARKHAEAIARNAKWQSKSTVDKIKCLQHARGNSKKQLAKLEKQLAAENKT